MSDPLVITVLFTCHKCGLQRVRVVVPARGRSQGVVAWMEVVARKCGERHSQLSPTCPERKVDLAIPFPVNEGGGIGMSAAAVPEVLSPDFMKSEGAN